MYPARPIRALLTAPARGQTTIQGLLGRLRTQSAADLSLHPNLGVGLAQGSVAKFHTRDVPRILPDSPPMTRWPGPGQPATLLLDLEALEHLEAGIDVVLGMVVAAGVQAFPADQAESGAVLAA